MKAIIEMNNIPAFPQPTNSTLSWQGMTLRDYFAAKAMQGDISSMVDPHGERCGLQIDLSNEDLFELSKLYYRMSDAMIEARKQ